MKTLSFRVPGFTFDPPPNVPNTSTISLSNIIQTGIVLLFIVAVILATVFLIWGGIQWIMSGGDKQKIEQARARIIYAIIGLVVTFAAFLIISTIGHVFRINLS